MLVCIKVFYREVMFFKTFHSGFISITQRYCNAAIGGKNEYEQIYMNICSLYDLIGHITGTYGDFVSYVRGVDQ